MDPVTMGLIGAGVGAAKSELIDRPREERQRKMAAEMAIYSPWTGMDATKMIPGETDAFGSALQGATSGMMMGQGMQKHNQQMQMAPQNNLAMNYQSQPQGSPWVGMQPSRGMYA